jgi:predicted amidohydrolase YtcJ
MQKFLIAAVVVLACAGLAVADPAPDLILWHGRIHTEDPGRSVAEALAIRGNTIVAVGTDAVVGALRGPATRLVDLAGHVVLPGIIDAHIHPAQSAQDLGKCNLGDRALGAAEIRSAIGRCAAENPGDPQLWFEVTGVNASALTLTRDELDAMLPGRPLLLESADGHSAWLDSIALAAAHLGAASHDPVGGRIERDAAGRPTGTLRDEAVNLALKAKPAPSLDVEAAQLERAFALMRATGITSVQDADDNEHYLEIYKRLYDTHRLDMRVRGSYTLANLHEPATVLIGRAIRFRTRWAVDPDFLRIGGVKIFADGVVEYPSHTASLLEPYLDAAGHLTADRGPSYFTQRNLNRIVSAADAAGFTVHVHAIGDRAVRAALDAFAYSRAHNGPLDNRDQIAHLELVDPADLPRFRQLGVIANMQLLWARRDAYIVKGTLAYVGPERAARLYPARSLRDAGARLAGGSDWGVSSFNAFEAMERAITRADGRGLEPLFPEQGLRIGDVVDAYTINAAYALKQERTTGSLEPGKRADLILLDRDIFAIDPYDLHATRVLATYLDGREVYHADGP